MDSQKKGKENSFEVKSPRSPNVLRPKALYLKKKLKRSLSAVSVLQTIDPNVSVSGPGEINFSKYSPLKCINPFRCSPKKRKIEACIEEDEENSLLWRWTNKKISQITSDKVETLPSPDPVVPSVVNEDAHLGFGDDKHFLWAPEKKKSPEKTAQKSLPVDWSLKTKIRLISSKPFPWRSSLKTSEEASGTTGFVRCLHSSDSKKKECNLDSSHGAKFYQQCLTWMHPTLPWLQLFPRMNNRTNSSTFTIDSSLQETLHSNWCDSFRSLYQLVRTCQCPYFYLCAPTFTVIFRSGGIASILDIHAIISPTTRGFRNALKTEGIEFTMPLHQDSDSDSLGDAAMDENFQPNLNEDSINITENGQKNEPKDLFTITNELEVETAEEEEPGVWLESLGLSQQDFPALNPKKNKLEKGDHKNLDHRPQSLVYVEGAETQALVNFLLNYPSCVSRTGSMAGIPPTLLSPIAFLGSTLHALKSRHGWIKSGEKNLHTVELNGPILPNTVHALCSLLNTTQDGNFSVALVPHTPTVSFTMLMPPQSSSVPSLFATENLKDCGLPTSFVHQMCSRNLADKGGFTNISVNDGLFSWS